MKTIYVINFLCETDNLFYDLYSHRDEISRPFIYLREGIEQAGFRFQLTQDASNLTDAAALLSLCNINPHILANLSQIPKERRFFCITEPPIVLPQIFDPRLADYFGTIFTYFDEQVDHKSYFKMFHLQAYEKRIAPIPSFSDKKLCTMIQTKHPIPNHPHEIYSQRIDVANRFASLGNFDLYGRGWEGFSAWKGFVFNKSDILKNYRFCISYENMKDQPGYITDRIFDSLYNGCVPVYWGASNIEEFVPKECFIDRREFSSNEEVHRYLTQVDQKTYQSYLDAAEAYLSSKQAYPYTPKAFSEVILQKLLPVAMQG